MNKYFISSILFSLFIGFTLTSCGGDDDEPYYNPPPTSSFMAPTGLSGAAVSDGVMLSWNSVDGAEFYTVSRSSSINGTTVSLGYIGNVGKIYNTSVIDTNPLDGDNYYFIRACKNLVGNSYTASPESSPIYVHYTRNNNPSSGNDNPGAGNDPTPGGNTNTAPSAPTGLRVTPDGTSTAPYAILNWTAVSNATSYIVFRSSSANGSYSQVGTTSVNSYADQGVKYGNTYYYKVKASNNYGTSDYSSYEVCEFTDRRKPGPVTYGNCTVSGTSMTLRWSVPKESSYGTPTKAILRVKNPDSGIYADVQTLSGTATSATFTYTPWVDKDGFVFVGIILENENGTGGATPKVYDTKNKRWIN